MKKDDFDDAVQSSDTPAPAPHTAPEHVLQEEHTQVEENLQGRAITSSNSFPSRVKTSKNQSKINTFFKTLTNVDGKVSNPSSKTAYDTSLRAHNDPKFSTPLKPPGITQNQKVEVPHNGQEHMGTRDIYRDLPP